MVFQASATTPPSALAKLQDSLCLLLLLLIHRSFDLLLAVVATLRSGTRLFRDSPNSPTSHADVLLRCSYLGKRPEHVAFAVTEDVMSYADLANLVTWSLAAGIRNISLYDVKGVIKDHQKELLCAMRKSQQKLFHDDQFSFQISWHGHGSSENTAPEQGSFTLGSNGGQRNNGNGAKHEKSIVHIGLLSLDDGKGDIVRAARKIAEKVRANDLLVTNIDEQTVSECLATNKGMPDPDLLIRIGPVESNLGFLPWQIRLTEIHGIAQLQGIVFEDLFRVLSSYSKCSQRFGT